MDREKILKGLECCLGANDCDIEPNEDCPYRGMCLCAMALHIDILALLKEQDGKPMIENERGWNCPSCGMELIGKTASGYPCNLIDLPEDEPIHFCPMCGQEVKLN